MVEINLKASTPKAIKKREEEQERQKYLDELRAEETITLSRKLKSLFDRQHDLEFEIRTISDKLLQAGIRNYETAIKEKNEKLQTVLTPKQIAKFEKLRQEFRNISKERTMVQRELRARH